MPDSTQNAKGEPITKPDAKLQIESSCLIKELMTKKQQLRATADLPPGSYLDKPLAAGRQGFLWLPRLAGHGAPKQSSQEPPENCEN